LDRFNERHLAGEKQADASRLESLEHQIRLRDEFNAQVSSLREEMRHNPNRNPNSDWEVSSLREEMRGDLAKEVDNNKRTKNSTTSP